jgi:hypothetical protein
LSVQWREAADQKAAQDEREIWKQKLCEIQWVYFKKRALRGLLEGEVKVLRAGAEAKYLDGF